MIPPLLQFLIVRLMLKPKHACGKWFFNIVTIAFLGVCAILFTAIKEGSGSQMIIAVNIVLSVLELVYILILLICACTRQNLLEQIFPDNQRARVWVFLGVLFVMSIQNGCLASGFWLDDWLLSSTVALLFFDIVFLELALFYYYHFDVAHKITPTEIDMEPHA